MAKIRATEFNIQTGNVASVTVVMPPHEAGDMLLVFAGKDDATGTDPTTATLGWVRGGSGVSGGATTAAVRAAWFYKQAASSAEPDLVITSSDSDSWSILAISIKGVPIGSPTADLIDAHTGNGNTDSTGAPYAVTGVTTNYSNSLVIFACLSGGTGCPVHYPGLMGVGNVDSGNEGLGVAFMLKRSAGATGSKNFYTDAVNTNTIGFCVAVRDDGTGDEIPAYWDTDWATLIHPFRGSSTIITSDAWGTALTNYSSTGKAAVTACFQVDQSGGPSYVDYTTAANNATDADIIPYPATEAAGADGTGDWVCFGHTKPFNCLTFDTLGCTQGVGGVVAWEYWNGSAWVALASVTDGTTGFTAALADNLQVRWAWPANFNWAKRSINSSADLFYVRARCTTVWTTNPTLSQVYIGGLALLYDAVAAATDAGVIQFENAANISAATSLIQAGGTYIDLGQTVDVSAKIICGTYQFTLPRDYVDSARMKEGGGVHVFFADTSFNRKHWCVGSYLDKETSDANRNRFAIQWAQTVDTTLGRTTTDPSSTIADVFIGNLAPRGAGSLAFSHMVAVDPTNAVINGGSAANPITLNEFLAMGDASPLHLFENSRLMIPVIVGGSDPVHMALDGFTLTLPTVATPWSDFYTQEPYAQAHYDTGVLGFVWNLQPGDSVALTNGKITSPSRWKFEVPSTAAIGSPSCSMSASNLLLQNCAATLRAIGTWSGYTFQDSDISSLSATIDSCAFIDALVTCDSPATAALISNCTFTSSGSGHAIKISGTAADITLSGVEFSGYSAGSPEGNEEIWVDIASGSMEITIANSSSIPNVRTSGCVVTVSAPVIVTISAQVSLVGAEVRIYDIDVGSPAGALGTELAGSESHGSATFTYNGTAGNNIWVQVFLDGYKEYGQVYEVPVADATLAITLEAELNA